MFTPVPEPASDVDDVALLAQVLPSSVNARQISDWLDRQGGLRALLDTAPGALEKLRAMDPATAEALCALPRLAVRYFSERLPTGERIDSPGDTTAFLAARLHGLEHEVFCCVYLDNRHRVLGFEVLFRGTIDGTSVYPREVVKEALRRNAAALIVAHNHPSGVAEPSEADRELTRRLARALALVDIRLLDHIVIGDAESVSLASRGAL